VSPLARDLMIAGLVNQCAATIAGKNLRADGKPIAVAKTRISEVGRTLWLPKVEATAA
jgi:hypothetical protein